MMTLQVTTTPDTVIPYTL